MAADSRHPKSLGPETWGAKCAANAQCDLKSTDSAQFYPLKQELDVWLLGAKLGRGLNSRVALVSQFAFLSISGAIELTLRPNRFKLRRYRERALTGKHLSCFTKFLHENGPDWAVVFEGDAGLVQDSADRMLELSNFLQDLSGPTLIFIAEGFSPSQLRVKLEDSGPLSAMGGHKTQPATSNTTCAYILNREAAQIIRLEFHKRPHLPADWLIADVARKKGITTYLFNRPLIAHNSRRLGESTIMERR